LPLFPSSLALIFSTFSSTSSLISIACSLALSASDLEIFVFSIFFLFRGLSACEQCS